MMRADAALPEGCTPQAFDQLAAAREAAAAPRDVFMYFISGAKEKAPAAAMALLQRLR